MLLGTWSQALDRRNNLVMPTPFRSLLGERLVVTRGFDRCLQGFGPSAWADLVKQVQRTPIGLPDGRALRRHLFAGAADLMLDERGRIALPAILCAYAELHEEVVVVGLDHYFEIWAAPTWQQAVEDLKIHVPLLG